MTNLIDVMVPFPNDETGAKQLNATIFLEHQLDDEVTVSDRSLPNLEPKHINALIQEACIQLHATKKRTMSKRT